MIAKSNLVVTGHPKEKAPGVIHSFYKFGARVSGGFNPKALENKKVLMGSDKYFTLKDVNLGPKDIAS
jgi:hypothetical protein